MTDLAEPAPEPDVPDLPSIDDLVASMSNPEDTPPPEPAPEPGAAPEPPAEPPSAPLEPVQDPREARGLEMLAERERALRAEQEAWRQEREADLEALQKFNEHKTLLERGDALKALELLGYDFDQVSAAALEGRGVSPTSALEESITAKLTEQEQRLQAQMDQLAQARYEADMATFRAHATGVVRESAPALAGAFGEDAVDIIRQRYETLAEAQRHRGEKVNLPPIEDVVRDMERETLDFATRLKEIPAVRALFGQPAKSQDASPTLRNAHVASAPIRRTEIDTDDLEGDALFEALARKHFPA